MRRRARRGGGRQLEVTITFVGARGDGLAEVEGRTLYVPLSLPGERLRVRLVGERAGGLLGEPVELLESATERCEAPCPHFGSCGGCALQHWEPAAYSAWKQALVVQALARCGLPSDLVAPLISIPAGTRRRAAFAAECRGGKVTLGFHGRASHAVVGIEGCLLLAPALTALLPVLESALPSVLEEGETADLVATATESGIDLLLATRQMPTLATREALAALAETADLARLSWKPAGQRESSAEPAEPIALRRPPQITFGQVAVTPPPGGFLQPSREGEAALVALIGQALPAKLEKILELFAGCGSFSFDLAQRAPLHAVEGDRPSLSAVRQAADRAGLGAKVGSEHRDLVRRPYTTDELKPYDCVVFDPPRAGAREQVEQIAQSQVGAVVAVSCNPATFARDARILVDGGFRLLQVTPLDQFPWSGHVELVAAFRR